jgi:putative lipoprotein
MKLQKTMFVILALVLGLVPVLAQDAQPQPLPEPIVEITIADPLEGETVNVERGLEIVGTAFGVPENNVIVRVVDTYGTVLVPDTPTTADASGNWSIIVRPGAVNAEATIVAFATSPADGLTVAESRVRVILAATVQPPTSTPVPPTAVPPTDVPPTAVPPTNVPPTTVPPTNVPPTTVPPVGRFVNITSPGNGSQVWAPNFAVTGTSSGLHENNVVVEVRDTFGRAWLTRPTTADMNGNWSIGLSLLVANNTPAVIVAFSQSPADGSIWAQSSVTVTMVSDCSPRADWPVYTVQQGESLALIAQRTGSSVDALVRANCLPNPNVIFPGQQLRVPRLPWVPGPVTPVPGTPVPTSTPIVGDAEVNIQSPAANVALPTSGMVTVTGNSANTLEGSILVRALDNMGRVVASATTEVTGTGANQSWTWQADLDIMSVPDGTRGKLFAYAVDHETGGIGAHDVMNVVYGTPGNQFIVIDNPEPYTTLNLQGALTISGTAAGLFEGNVVVRALDDQGNVLAEQPTTVQTNEVGGEGPWQVSLNVGDIRRGTIYAFSPSPVDGSPMAEASVDVVFGDVSQLATFVVLDFPLPNALITEDDSFWAASGRAGGTFNAVLTALVLDQNDNVLLSRQVSADASGHWSVIVDADPLTQSQDLRVRILASNFSGGTIAADTIPVRTFTEQGEIVTPQPPPTLPPHDFGYVTGIVSKLDRMMLPPGVVLTVTVEDVSRADAPATVIGQQVQTLNNGLPAPFSVQYDLAAIDPAHTYSVRAQIHDTEGNLIYTSTTINPVITNGAPSFNLEIMVEPV